MKTALALALAALAVLFARTSYADTFGSGANQFEIEFVTIGDPGNPDDTSGNPNPVGNVEYAYRLGKFEVSEDMIDKANAEGGLGITKDTRGPNKPATSVSWFEAAVFVNWLNDQKGASPAYKFNGSTFELWEAGDPGYDSANPFRNIQAHYFLPSADEWYKAAYYDPIAGIYYDYPTGSDAVPDGIDFIGDTTFDAVFEDGAHNSQPNDITDVGVLSPYGTAGQGGNVSEWEETEIDLINDSPLLSRGTRGGFWSNIAPALRSSDRGGLQPAISDGLTGFRVASIPEPSTTLMVAWAAGTILMRRSFSRTV